MMNTAKAIGWIAGMLIIAGGPIRAADKEVTWRADYDVARKEATENGRPVFLEFHTEECFHCRRLEAGPLRDPSIVALLNERFVPLRVDASKSPKLTEALTALKLDEVINALRRAFPKEN